MKKSTFLISLVIAFLFLTSLAFAQSDPVITNCSPNSAITWFWFDWTRDFEFTDADPGDTHTWSVQSIGYEPIGTYSIDPITGFFIFSPDEYDGGSIFIFEVKVEDSYGGVDICQIEIEICACGPIMVQIEKTHNTIQGHYEYVSINKLSGGELMGGFDFLLGYDASALTFVSAELGDLLDADGCGWEYFNYNPGAFGNCNGPCPSGKLRIVSIADQLNGANHPSCYGGNGELVSLKFYVTNNRTYECQYAPIRFCWEDCGDNAISSTSGDTLFISQEVYEFEWDGNFSNDDFKITGLDCPANGFHYGGACEDCDVSDKTEPVRFIWFWNGGVDIVCADSIDDICDMNFNAIPYEIADAVEFTRYFLYGISIVPPPHQEAFIAASDCNKDGNPLSVGDLVHLLRVIVGDALPFNMRVPFAEEVEITTKAGQFITETTSVIGAIFAVYNITSEYQITNNTNMELTSAEEDGKLRVLLYAGIDNPANYLNAGTNNIFTIEGHLELVELQVSDYQGNLLETQIKKYSLPTDYLLHQNSPNPFNPTTKITLDLPEITNWQITIYNVTGQQIESFSGRDVGSVIVEWNAEHAASGIYFYKVTAGNFAETKKMILIK